MDRSRVKSRVRSTKKKLRKISIQRTEPLKRPAKLQARLHASQRRIVRNRETSTSGSRPSRRLVRSREVIPQPELPEVENQLGDPRYQAGEIRYWDQCRGEWVPFPELGVNQLQQDQLLISFESAKEAIGLEAGLPLSARVDQPPLPIEILDPNEPFLDWLFLDIAEQLKQLNLSDPPENDDGDERPDSPELLFDN